MKFAFFPLTVLISTTTWSNTPETAFKRNSEVPVELKARILSALERNCSNLIAKDGLSEQETTVRIDQVDQGIRDHFYTTTFSSRYYFDGSHPITTTITVESAQYDFVNGDNLEVISISSPDGCER